MPGTGVLSSLVAGFPHADELYFDNPGPMMAGWFAMQASGAIQPHPVATPPGSLLLDPPVKHFGSLSELSRFLKSEHRSGFWYRGQSKRFSCLYRGALPRLSEAFPHITDVSVTFEGIIPSVYRRVVASQPADWRSVARQTSRLNLLAPAIRAIAGSANAGARQLAARFIVDAARAGELLVMLGMGVQPSADIRSSLFAEGTGVLRSELELTALSQHYEFGSTMIDVTFDVDVATWFASHKWSDGSVLASPGMNGFIYRFDRGAIVRMLSDRLLWGSGRSPFIPHVGLFGVAEIAHLPAHVGKRPAAQAGGSLFGMELSCNYFLLDAYRAMSVFSFPHNSVTGNETPRTLNDLCPADDPGTRLFDPTLRSSTHPLTNTEITTFLQAEGTSSSDVSAVIRMRGLGAM